MFTSPCYNCAQLVNLQQGIVVYARGQLVSGGSVRELLFPRVKYEARSTPANLSSADATIWKVSLSPSHPHRPPNLMQNALPHSNLQDHPRAVIFLLFIIVN